MRFDGYFIMQDLTLYKSSVDMGRHACIFIKYMLGIEMKYHGIGFFLLASYQIMKPLNGQKVKSNEYEMIWFILEGWLISVVDKYEDAITNANLSP